MNNTDRLVWFHLLSLVTTVLSVLTMVLSLYGNWRHVAGAAIAACIVYQVRIWLIRSLVK
jgi:hypothetical protein